jgi:hypothetical protein
MHSSYFPSLCRVRFCFPMGIVMSDYYNIVKGFLMELKLCFLVK